jgi:hypothetical protein
VIPAEAIPAGAAALELWALDVAGMRIAKLKATLEVNGAAKSVVVK